MAWTVSTDKQKHPDGTVVVFLVYTDGTRTIRDALDVKSGLTDDVLAVTAKARIQWLQAQDDAYAAISLGTVTPKDPDPVIDPQPTPSDLLKQQFLTDYRKLQQSNKAISLGLLDVKDQTYIDLVSKVKGEFQIDYLDLI